MGGATSETGVQESLWGVILCWKTGISSSKTTCVRCQTCSETCASNFVPAPEIQQFSETQTKPTSIMLFITQWNTTNPDSYRSVRGYTIYTNLSSGFSLQLALCCPSTPGNINHSWSICCSLAAWVQLMALTITMTTFWKQTAASKTLAGPQHQPLSPQQQSGDDELF